MMVDSLAWEMAAAKINLSLKIIGRRADGYHLLSSVVAFADFGDRVSIDNRSQPTGGVELEICGSESKALVGFDSGDNLVIRAAKLLLESDNGRQKLPSALGLRLEKNLPIASGIGGGSADAAASLRLLNRHFGLGFSTSNLAEMSQVLGADVPACVWSQSLILSGIGEEIDFITLPGDIYILLVNPRIALPTAAVFAAYRGGDFSRQISEAKADWNGADFYDHLRHQGNDLTAAAITIVPTIGEVLQGLENLAGAEFVAMSGSGASCFALFNTVTACDSAAKTLSRQHPEWWIQSGRLV